MNLGTENLKPSVLDTRRIPKKNGILTLRAAAKVSLHELLINIAFAHARRSGVGVIELTDAMLVGTSSRRAAFKFAQSLLEAERHCCEKPKKGLIHADEQGEYEPTRHPFGDANMNVGVDGVYNLQ
jgi:hypothetical protein